VQSKRDQVLAHRFMVSRLTGGLLRADPDDPESPTRRTNRGLAYGGVFGAVGCIGFLVFGLIVPGGATSWQNGKTLIVAKETGTRFLYDGQLRPVRNFASARLIVGAGLTTDSVSTNSLADTKSGSPVGIAGAPDDLPSAGDLNQGPWEVCAYTKPTDSGDREPATSLVVDSDVPGIGVQGDRGVLVKDSDGKEFLVWRGNRFRLGGGQNTANALGFTAATPLSVSAAFLDALPAGTDLAAPPVAGVGDKGPELDGEAGRVGQVFLVQTPGSAQQYYLLRREGLTPITATQAALSLGDPEIRAKAYGGSGPKALPLAAEALNDALAPGSSKDGPGDVKGAGKALPAVPPTLLPVDDDQAACVRLATEGDAGTQVSVVLVSTAQLASGAVPPSGDAVAPCLAVDSISLPTHGGSLVRALGAGGGEVGDTTYLVTGAGVKFHIMAKDAADALGYDLSAARGLPSPLLNMLPTGPDLSTQNAATGVSTVSGNSDCGSKAAGGS
jgi:type VII secretion protein EccB